MIFRSMKNKLLRGVIVPYQTGIGSGNVFERGHFLLKYLRECLHILGPYFWLNCIKFKKGGLPLFTPAPLHFWLIFSSGNDDEPQRRERINSIFETISSPFQQTLDPLPTHSSKSPSATTNSNFNSANNISMGQPSSLLLAQHCSSLSTVSINNPITPYNNPSPPTIALVPHNMPPDTHTTVDSMITTTLQDRLDLVSTWVVINV